MGQPWDGLGYAHDEFDGGSPGAVPSSGGGTVKFLRADGEWQVPAGGGGAPEWVDVQNKPSTFAPISHTHDWADVTGEPATFPPSTHTHMAADITDLPASSSPLDAWPVGSIFLSVVNTNPSTLLGGGTWVAFAAGRVLVGVSAAEIEFDTLEETGGAKTVTLTEAQLPAHTHVQNAHTHVQDAHTHVQNSHNHTQNSFAPRIVNSGTAGTVGVQGASTASNSNASNAATTATNQVATAVNQNATATNQNATAVNQNTGSGSTHDNLQPYIVVCMWKRTA